MSCTPPRGTSTMRAPGSDRNCARWPRTRVAVLRDPWKKRDALRAPVPAASADPPPAADAPPAVDLPPEDLRGGLVCASWPVSLQGSLTALCAR